MAVRGRKVVEVIDEQNYRDGYIGMLADVLAGLREEARGRKKDLKVITDPADYRACEGERDALEDIIKLIKENL